MADSWTAESKITAAIKAMAKETQHAARKLRIDTLQVAVVLRYGPRIGPAGPAVPMGGGTMARLCKLTESILAIVPVGNVLQLSHHLS